MSEHHLTLALGFIQEEPRAAAQILEQGSHEETAGFFSTIPLSYASRLLECMLPAYAAKLCVILGSVQSGAVLGNLDVSCITRILRLLGYVDSNRILEELRKSKSDACRLLLRYSSHSIGAWMTPHAFALVSSMNVKNVLTYLQTQSGEDNKSGICYVVDQQGHLQGQVSLIEILCATPSMELCDLMSLNAASLSVHALLDQVRDHPVWDEQDMVAVTDRDHQLLGHLRYADLRKGLAFHSDDQSQYEISPDPMLAILNSYGHTLKVLSNTALNIVETDLHSREGS
jgi:Mg/Co/Ni transporter MgtE